MPKSPRRRRRRLRRAIGGAPAEERLQQRGEHIGEGDARVVGSARGEGPLRQRLLERHAAREAVERVGQRAERDDVVDGDGVCLGAGQAASRLHVARHALGRHALERALLGAPAHAGQVRAVPAQDAAVYDGLPTAIGGFIGFSVQGTVINCESSVYISTMVSSNWVGAFAGYVQSFRAENCIYDEQKAPGWEVVDVVYNTSPGDRQDIRAA